MQKKCGYIGKGSWMKHNKKLQKNRVRTLAEIDTLKTPFITRMYVVSRLVVTSRATSTREQVSMP